MVKKTCGIDVTNTIQGLVVAMDADEKGAIFVSLKGVDEAGLTSCLQKVVAQEEKGKKISSKRGPDNIVEYSAEGEKEHLYVAFLGKDVCVMATDPTDRSLLQRFLSGGGGFAKGDFGRALARTNTSAAVWGVVNKPEQVTDGVNMKMAHGDADVVKGTVTVNGHMMLGSKKEATEAASKMKQQLDAAKKDGSIPPQFASLVKSVSIAANDDDLAFKASLPEKELLQLIGSFMK
jgi:hypothetical protein